MRTIVTIAIIILAVFATILIVSKFSDKPVFGQGIAEKAGASIDRAAAKAADAAEEATQKAGKAIEKVGEKMQN